VWLIFDFCNDFNDDDDDDDDDDEGVAAQDRYNERIKKYDAVIAQYNNGPNQAFDTFTVVPFVAETSGY